MKTIIGANARPGLPLPIRRPRGRAARPPTACRRFGPERAGAAATQQNRTSPLRHIGGPEPLHRYQQERWPPVVDHRGDGAQWVVDPVRRFVSAAVAGQKYADRGGDIDAAASHIVHRMCHDLVPVSERRGGCYQAKNSATLHKRSLATPKLLHSFY